MGWVCIRKKSSKKIIDSQLKINELNETVKDLNKKLIS